MTAPDPIRAMLHDMAQPAAAASLAVDLALHELQRGQVEAARARLTIAADSLAVLQGQLRRHATGPGPADPRRGPAPRTRQG